MRALVTGCNGHLGAALVELLVTSGHQVRGSMRGIGDEKKTAPLKKLGVELVEADVLDAAALERACEGIEVVFHLAAVFRFVVDDPQRDLIDPAVKGAEFALRAAKKAGVRRVVLTSSSVAVGHRHLDRRLDERDWNDGATNPYAKAKTLAERKAWELAKELSLDLVCINPVGLLGPGFARHTPMTLNLANMIDGKLPAVPPFVSTYVDNRDAAQAHVLAAENPKASGRYLVANEALMMLELAQRLKAVWPEAKVPTRVLPRWAFPFARFFDWAMNKTRGVPRQLSSDVIEEYGDPLVRYSAARAQSELGWNPRPFDETLRETAEWIAKTRPAAW